MKIIKEQATKTKDSWIETLDIKKEDFSFLLENGILKPELKKDKKVYRNRFVGFIALSNDIIFSEPKYWKKSNSFEFNFLLKIFSQYTNRKDKNTSIKKFDYYGLDTSNYNEALFEYNTYISILSYYMNYGIYSVENKKYNYNTYNRVSWNRTIDSSIAIHSEDSLFYHNPISISLEENDNIISSIQISILTYLEKKYNIENSSDLDLVGSSKYQKISILDLISNSNTWNNIIQNTLSKTYLQHDIHLLNLMSSFLTKKAFNFSLDKKSLYGTISFHNIWEDACSLVFNNQYSSLKDKLAQPIWKFTGLSGKSSGEQIPDILVENDTSIYILDAKYYYPLPYRTCGWGDIVKQYFYEKSYKNELNKNVINALLFPNEEAENCEFKGDIIMERDTVSEVSFPLIKIYEINPTLVFNLYIKNKVKEDLLELIV